MIKGDSFAAALQLAASVLESRGEVAPEEVARVVVACYKGIEMAEQRLREEGPAGREPGGEGLRRR